MYYILNETNQLIAADEEMLSLCGVAHIDELSSKIAKDNINLHLTGEGDIIIRTDEDEKTYSVTETSLSSLLGYLHLIQISTELEENDEVSITTPAIEDDSTDLIDSIIHDEEESLDVIEEETATPLLSETEKDEEITFGDHLDVNDDIMELKDTETTEEETPLLAPEEDKETELFDLLGDSDEVILQETPEDEKSEEETLDLGLSDEEEIFLKDKEEAEVTEISINIDEISQKIGISSDDYQNFLNEFIDTALGLEKDLQSNDENQRAEATSTLSYLAEVLHLPVIGDIITDISNADETNQRNIIESFYGTLSRITTTQVTEENAPIDVQTPEVEEELELFDEPEVTEELMIQEEVTPRKTSSGPSFGTISLEGIKPKHFDFQLEEAANDLSLPVELIEEFVHDFIDQAHIETKKMLEAYEDGDLDAIQKIGHLLKGASSNLRINPLSDTLYKIQFCEDPSQLEILIKDYWAHFLSFENQINVISN